MSCEKRRAAAQAALYYVLTIADNTHIIIHTGIYTHTHTDMKRRRKMELQELIKQGELLVGKDPALDLRLSEVDVLYKEFYSDKDDEGLAEAVFNLIGRTYYTGLARGRGEK